MKNKKCAVLSSLFLSFSILLLFVFLVLNENKDSVNNFLHINTSKIVNEESSSSNRMLIRYGALNSPASNDYRGCYEINFF